MRAGDCMAWREVRVRVSGCGVETDGGGDLGGARSSYIVSIGSEGAVFWFDGGGCVGGERFSYMVSTGFEVAVSWFDEVRFASASACRSVSNISNSFRNVQAASRRSGVGRLITPRVKCRAPTGRIAFGESGLGLVSLGVVTSFVKRAREERSWGWEEGVMRGRQRKCVRGGFGGLGGISEEGGRVGCQSFGACLAGIPSSILWCQAF